MKQAGQNATLAQYGYDGLNRLTQVLGGPTGTPIETYAFDATGNRTSLTNGIMVSGTVFKRVTQPDGSYTAYRYDAAQRLIGIDDNAGNRIRYTLGNASNRIREDTRDPNGTLTRILSRVYNQLGQLQSKTGVRVDFPDRP